MVHSSLADSAAVGPDNTAHLISTVRRTMNQFLVEEMQRSGMYSFAPSHGDIVVTLLHHSCITMSELAERIHRDPSTVTTLVRKLEKAGYVETIACPQDTRVRRVSLTQKGCDLETTFGDISMRLAQVMWQDISPEDRETMRRVLGQIAENFANYQPDQN